VGIPYGSTPATCPVRALKDWLAVLKTDKGPALWVGQSGWKDLGREALGPGRGASGEAAHGGAGN
jgi:hypothetical protein